jgi:hypothetical protein
MPVAGISVAAKPVTQIQESRRVFMLRHLAPIAQIVKHWKFLVKGRLLDLRTTVGTIANMCAVLDCKPGKLLDYRFEDSVLLQETPEEI